MAKKTQSETITELKAEIERRYVIIAQQLHDLAKARDELQVLRPAVAQLEADLELAKAAITEERIAKEKAIADLKFEQTRTANTLLDATRRVAERDKDIAALKAELFRAHQTVATQAGYIARTLEDDNVRELGPCEIDPRSNVIAGPQSRRGGISSGIYDGSSYGREAPKPWHDR